MNFGRRILLAKDFRFLIPFGVVIFLVSFAFNGRLKSNDFDILLMQSLRLIDAQQGSQGVAIGQFGTSSLFIKLLESSGQFQVTSIRLKASGYTSLERQFSPKFDFMFSERLGLNRRFEVVVANTHFSGTVAVSKSVFIDAAVLATAVTCLLTSMMMVGLWIYRSRILLSKSFARAELARQVAHDIRSPLTAINLLASQMSESNDVKRKILVNAVARINGIAEDLLEKSRAESRLQNISETRIAELEFESTLRSLVHEKEIEYSIANKIKFALDIPHQDQTIVYASQDHIARVLSNLLNNAAESMQDRTGQITIAVRRYAQLLEVSIVDRGCGIPVHILERLGKERISFGKEKSGSGIGLFQAKEYVESIGGSIAITSHVNRGTIVRLSLKRAA